MSGTKMDSGGQMSVQDMLSLLEAAKGSSQTSTTKSNISDAGIQSMLQDILSGSQGLAAVSSPEHASGLYNSTTNQMLTNNLEAKVAGELAQKQAGTTTTTRKNPQVTGKDLLELAGTTIGRQLLSPTFKTLSGKLGVNDLGNKINDMIFGTGAPADAVVAPGVSTTADLSTLPAGFADNAVSDTLASIPSVAADGTVSAASDAGATSAAADTAAATGIGAGNVATATTADLSTLPAGYTSSAVADTIPAAIGADAAGAGAGAGAGAAEAAGGAGSDLAASAAADETSALGSASEAGPWAALAVYGALDLNQDIKQGNQDVLWSDALGGLGTGDIVGAAEQGGSVSNIIANAAGPGAGIVQGAENALGWIVCTELRRQGKMPNRFYIYGQRKFNEYSDFNKQGYYFWAVPAVHHLRNHPNSKLSSLLRWAMVHRAEFVSAQLGCPKARKTLLGAVITYSMYWICVSLAHTIARKPIDWSKVYVRN